MVPPIALVADPLMESDVMLKFITNNDVKTTLH